MIEAVGLTRRFGDLVAVDDLSLRVPDGAILAFLGPNGAGKTTTVRMLAGLLAPSAGSAVVAGHDVRLDPAAVRARIGLVTDVPGLYEQMTTPDYLSFFGRIYGLDGASCRRRIDDLLAFFELDGHRKSRMAGFSRGMKQKVALARALLHEPEVLFLDEPTSGLDPLAARALRDVILELKHDSRSIVLCTHDLAEAERLADEIAIIRHGRLIARDAPEALRTAGSTDMLVRVTFAAPLPHAPGLVAGLDDLEDLAQGPTGALTYRTRQPNTVNPAAIARLVAAGASIVSVSCEVRSLEDAYAAAMAGAEDAGTVATSAEGGAR
ncbi:MAG TPA: ABC transporter ATP-binding protein [Thermomicrobiaceae bacterium]|nr:ABC transporter ATP-binding protein [Thermomicrobiaceae bacterium]